MLIWSSAYAFLQTLAVCLCVCWDGRWGVEWKFRTWRKSATWKMSLKEFHPELDAFSSFIKPISFSAKVIWDTDFPHLLPLLISLPAEKVSVLQLFPSPSTGPCLHLVNKVGKGPGSSPRAPSVPNALNGHDTALNFRFTATAGGTSVGQDLGPVTVSSTMAISVPVIRCHLEPAILQCQAWRTYVTVSLFGAQVSLQASNLPVLKQP